MSGIQTAGNLIGAYEREQAASNRKTGDSSQLGKDAFLHLLVTQLENQDPLKPMEDTQFVSQLAQFSSLEKMTSISSGIDTLVEKSSQDMLSGVTYIGKGVMSSGKMISKVGEQASSLYYTTEEPTVRMTINVFDNDGNLVDSEELGAQQAGTYAFNWDGKDYDGQVLPDGNYNVAIAAETVEGKAVMTSTEVAGVVTSVESSEGKTLLHLSDGRFVDILDVREVAMVPTGSGAQEEGVSDTSGETGD